MATDDGERPKGTQGKPKNGARDTRFAPKTSGNPKSGPQKKAAEAMRNVSTYDRTLVELGNRKVRGRNGELKAIFEILAEHYVTISLQSAESSINLKQKRFNEGQHREIGAVMRELRESYKAHDDAMCEAFAWYVTRAQEIKDKLDLCHKTGRKLPDILPHPDHVVWNGNLLEIRGPETREGQKIWEVYKFLIRSAVRRHRALREVTRLSPNDQDLTEQLAKVEKERRQLMRKVPKGWREQIITLDSDPRSLFETVCALFNVDWGDMDRHMLAQGWIDDVSFAAAPRGFRQLSDKEMEQRLCLSTSSTEIQAR